MPVHVSRDRFEQLVRDALAELPAPFRRYLRGLEVRVEDYPDDELMAEWGLVPPNYPFGMYEGPALPEVEDRDVFPGVMIIYQRPLEAWCRSEEELCDQIRRTVYHELGHRFGFSDEGMPDELRAGAGTPWPEAARRGEAGRYLRQAEHDLAAAEALLAGGHHDWALDAALAAADRALRAFLFVRGEDPEAVAQEGVPELLARAARRDPPLRRLRPLLRLDQIALDMGDAGAPSPAERVRPKWAQEAIAHARELVAKARNAWQGGR
ncbi:MAG: metallopeptidase family protein [Candidatus Acetothermia bacterium]|jgi:predicted Zn-dependent protease with MMP-like domain/HEPN domain-containing protein|nr:metallopeptidase family protein [Candidatus Acetothermia bacterium]